MYSETTCWTYFRFQKLDTPYLLRELELADGSDDWTDGRWHTPEGYVFEPMEALVTFLGRMAYPCTWEQRVVLFGGRSTAAYKSIFQCRSGRTWHPIWGSRRAARVGSVEDTACCVHVGA